MRFAEALEHSLGEKNAVLDLEFLGKISSVSFLDKDKQKTILLNDPLGLRMYSFTSAIKSFLRFTL